MPKKKNKRLTAENKTEEVIEAFRQTSQRENSTDVLGSWTGNPKDGGQPAQDYELNDPDIHTDVLGSYTGTAQDGEHPVQDADDL